MSLKSIIIVAAASLMIAGPALAGDITVKDAYARVSSPVSKSGAAFMVLHNAGTVGDRLIAAATNAAAKAGLHTHIDAGGGVMQMREDPDGFPVPAGGSHALARGGDHVMLMGLTRPLEHGDSITLTLTFEKAGAVTVEVPVDLERMPAQERMHMNNGTD